MECAEGKSWATFGVFSAREFHSHRVDRRDASGGPGVVLGEMGRHGVRRRPVEAVPSS
jgi:hypothetical protein